MNSGEKLGASQITIPLDLQCNVTPRGLTLCFLIFKLLNKLLSTDSAESTDHRDLTNNVSIHSFYNETYRTMSVFVNQTQAQAADIWSTMMLNYYHNPWDSFGLCQKKPISQTASGAMTVINREFGFGLIITTGEFNHKDVSCVIPLNNGPENSLWPVLFTGIGIL